MSNADKLKKYSLYRKTEIGRIEEVYAIAQKALADPSNQHYESIFKAMYDDLTSI